MAGLKRIAKMYGGMIIQGVRYVYDYVSDECVTESEMPFGSERWKASEKKKWEDFVEANKENLPKIES